MIDGLNARRRTIDWCDFAAERSITGMKATLSPAPPHGSLLLHLITLLLGLTLGAVATGCRPDSDSHTGAAPLEVYTLVSVDGKAVPARIQHEGASLEVRSGSFTLGPERTCQSRITFVPPTGRELTRETTATYVQDGSRLMMSWKGAGKTMGILDGDQFTMTNEGTVFGYRK